MNGDGTNLKTGIAWMKGRMRPEVEASACVHLAISQFLHFDRVPSEVTNEQGQHLMALVMNPAETRLYLSCQSEALLAAVREEVKLQPALDQQVTKIAVTLEICRMCPFFERPQ